MDIKEIMALSLRRKRHDLQMTEEELAERAGLSARYVGVIERGDVSASVMVLGQIAEALGVEPGDLLKKARRLANRKPPEACREGPRPAYRTGLGQALSLTLARPGPEQRVAFAAFVIEQVRVDRRVKRRDRRA
ncbi:transcriptional regulator with XRE-family HTH domain [Bradyrhizobium japonicum]